MKKAELIGFVASKSELTKQDTKRVFDGLFTIISATLTNEKKIQIAGFSTFEVHERPERTERNPKTAEQIVIAATKVPAFKSCKELKEALK